MKYPDLKRFFFFLPFLLFFSAKLLAQDVYVLELKDEINISTARYISKGLDAAKKAGAGLVIVHLDTYGGRVDYADSIRSDLLDTRLPTAVFIDKNAISAGAVISMACDSIYMAPGASIGAATVVEGGTGQAAPDKYQSFWRGIMRSTAEQKGRNPAIAEKMVDQNLDLPGISPQGQVITFSVNEAIANKYCEGQVESIQNVIARFGMTGAKVVKYTGTTVDQFINLLIQPGVSGFLMLMIFGGLFLEMKTPGMGFAGLVALLGIALFFAPHYVEGLAESWEIAVFAAGVVLIALEIFVIPGFGVAGIAGIVLAVFGLAAALLDNDGISFEYVSAADVLRSTALVLVTMATSILLVVWLARYLVTSTAAYPFVDGSIQDRAKGYTAVDQAILDLVGKEAMATTDLRPSGYIEIDGKKYDAEAKEGFIPKGTRVVVERVRSINLIVKPV